MSFFPILSANLYVAHIELIQTISSAGASGATAKMNLGAILHDSGGILSISNNQIVCPQGYEYMCLACITQNAKTGSNLIGTVVTFFVDGAVASSTLIGTWMAGVSSGFGTSPTLIGYLKTVSAQSALSICDNNSSSGFTIPYNSATSTVPNSAITILYKAL